MKLTLICGFFLLLGMFLEWFLVRKGSRKIPPVNCIRPGDNEWIEKQYFDVNCSDMGITTKEEKKGGIMKKIGILMLCVLIIICFVGCRRDLSKLCKDWQMDVRDLNAAIVKAEEMHELHPDKITLSNIKVLEYMRDRRQRDAIEICLIDEMIPGK